MDMSFMSKFLVQGRDAGGERSNGRLVAVLLLSLLLLLLLLLLLAVAATLTALTVDR